MYVILNSEGAMLSGYDAEDNPLWVTLEKPAAIIAFPLLQTAYSLAIKLTAPTVLSLRNSYEIDMTADPGDKDDSKRCPKLGSS